MFHNLPKITLASSSPRRVAILQQLKIDFECLPPNIEETSQEVNPQNYVQDIAQKKAQAVYMQSKQSIIVAADTIAHCNNTILQKPRNRSEASAMLQSLSGIVHQVYTAICVLEKQGPAKPHCIVKSAVADVEMAIIRPEELAAYLATGEWQGVAGAYRIQGLGACFVQRINGENSTVQGLPIHLFYDILRQRKLSSDAFTE